METVWKKIVFMLLMMYLVAYSEQQAAFDIQIFSTTNSATVLKSSCKVTFPEGYTQHNIIWEFNGLQVSVNRTRKTDNSDRLYAQYNELRNENRTHSSFLSIYRALKSDEGNYTCLAEYYIGNTKHVDKKAKFISIIHYLPAPDYPKCSASPLVVYDGDDIAFSCDPGDSNPPMDVTLVLVGPEGAETYLETLSDISEVTKMMSLNNTNAFFVCHITSTTFIDPASKNYVTRNCSKGPIIVYPRSTTLRMRQISSTESASTMSTTDAASDLVRSPNTAAHLYEPGSSESTTNVHTSITQSKPRSQKIIRIIIGSAVGGAMIIILLIIIICLVMRMSKDSTKPSTSKDHPMDNIEKAASNAASMKTQDDSMQVYSEVDKDTPNLKTTSKASNHTNKPQEKSNQETNEDQEIPVYAISSMEGAADHTNGDKMTNDMPIYSQVNKGTDMVENMIYEPAGPM